MIEFSCCVLADIWYIIVYKHIFVGSLLWGFTPLNRPYLFSLVFLWKCHKGTDTESKHLWNQEVTDLKSTFVCFVDFFFVKHAINTFVKYTYGHHFICNDERNTLIFEAITGFSILFYFLPNWHPAHHVPFVSKLYFHGEKKFKYSPIRESSSQSSWVKFWQQTHSRFMFVVWSLGFYVRSAFAEGRGFLISISVFQLFYTIKKNKDRNSNNSNVVNMWADSDNSAIYCSTWSCPVSVGLTDGSDVPNQQ